MLSPVLKEEVTGHAEIRETFKISKIGTIAGCMVTGGKVLKKSNVRLVRDGLQPATVYRSFGPPRWDSNPFGFC